MSRNVIELSQNHMATTFTLRVSCNPFENRAVESILSEAHRLISEIESEVSEFCSDSELSKINETTVGFTRHPQTESLRDLLRLSSRIFQETNGAYDPSFRSEGVGNFQDRFDYDAKTGAIRKKLPHARLGFGAIGKGYALDRVRTVLERGGITDYLLSAGGSSLVVAGMKSQHQVWPLAWSWEKIEDSYYGKEILYTPRGGTFAIGVSGSLEQGEHIVRTDHEQQLLSSWISGPSAAESDAYSTAVYAGGWEKSQEWFGKLPRRYARAGIFKDDQVLVWDGEFQSRFGSLDQSDKQRKTS